MMESLLHMKTQDQKAALTETHDSFTQSCLVGNSRLAKNNFFQNPAKTKHSVTSLTLGLGSE